MRMIRPTRIESGKAPLTGYRAEVVQQYRHTEPIVMPASGIHTDLVQAQHWVEEVYHQGLTVQVPFECLTGWVRYGDIAEHNGKLDVDLDRVTKVYCYHYVDGRLRWDETETFVLTKFPLSSNNEHWRI